MKCSLVIPCYNEEKSIPTLINRCRELADKNIEVIFVNNGSSDSSKKILQQSLNLSKNFVLLNLDVNHGYGNGILQGLKKASGEIIGWTHADLQTNPKDFLRGVELLSKNRNSFIKGKRYGRPLSDVFFTHGMSIFESILLKKIMWDINAQPTVFPKSFFEQWVNPPKDFSLDLYVYYQAKKKKLNILRFPVLFSKREFGNSSWNLGFIAKMRFIKRTLNYSFRLRRGLK